MNVNYQVNRHDKKSENTFEDSECIKKQTNNELKKDEHNEATRSESKSTKPLLAFKWQKSSSKVKTDLHGTAAKVFSSFDQDDDAKQSKNTLLFLKNGLSDDIPIANDKNVKAVCPYEEPIWSGLPRAVYKMNVLKAGVISQTLDLSFKSYHVIGTSLSSDITLSHKTISDFHAVLQYKSIAETENETGIFLYDLNSTHGSFLNGERIKSNTYIIVRGGDFVSFGNDQRKYVLHTPKDSEEQEAQLSPKELQELREIELQEQQQMNMQRLIKQNELKTMEQQESNGISWGIIDVDEHSRSTVTSESSESDNEMTYLDNPKKALQDWFKWEGHDLEYQAEDEGFGRFSCCIDLTLDALGSTKRIQVTVKGDRTKAIDECILKACKFLSDYGFLQQAYKEKKSTLRNWEAADYYDSDEDNYLDRTGAIEVKRQKRMEMDGKLKTQEMHNSLSEKYADVCKRIADLESSINLSKQDDNTKENSDEDALDVFMTELNTSSLSKAKIKDVKLEIQNLHKERKLLYNSINVNTSTSADQSDTHVENLTEKTSNGFRFNK